MIKNKLFMGLVLVLILVFVYILVLAKNKTQKAETVSADSSVCATEGKRIEIDVSSRGITPSDVKANLCDRLVFKNTDTHIHEPAFGTHDLHWPYPGYEEDILSGGKSVDFILTEVGEFDLHDHINPTATGKITISG